MVESDPSVKFDVLDRALARNLAWVAAADGKVPSVFAIDIAMLGVLCGLIPKANHWVIWTALSAAIAGLALIASVVSLALVAFPRLYGPKGSAIFFGGIVQHSEEAFLKKVLVGISEELLEDLARQTYRNAEIASEKFAYIRWAMLFMFLSAPFWLVSVAFLYTAR